MSGITLADACQRAAEARAREIQDERVNRIVDCALTEVAREYPDASQEAARATAALWLRRAAELLRGGR